MLCLIVVFFFLFFFPFSSVLGESCKSCNIFGYVDKYYCPREDYPSTHIYCCGPDFNEHCCSTVNPNYEEYTANLNSNDCSQLTFILTTIGVFAAIVGCCLCVPILICCYCLPCCPWNRCRKVNREQSEQQVSTQAPLYPSQPPSNPYLQQSSVIPTAPFLHQPYNPSYP